MQPTTIKSRLGEIPITRRRYTMKINGVEKTIYLLDEFLEINADYGRITILFQDMETADKFFEKKRLANLLKTEVKWEDYSLDKLQEVQKILGV